MLTNETISKLNEIYVRQGLTLPTRMPISAKTLPMGCRPLGVFSWSDRNKCRQRW